MNKKLLFFLLIPFLGFSQVQIGQDIVGDNLEDHFGIAVSMSADGNVVAVSTSPTSGNSYKKIYRNNSGTWTQVGQTIYSNSNERFNRTISLSGDGTVLAFVIGSLSTGNNTVRIYKNILGVWTQVNQDIVGNNINEIIGGNIALSFNGDIIVFTAISGGNNPKLRVHKNVLGTWTQVGQDIIGTDFSSAYGSSLSISDDGNIVAVSAPQNEINGIDVGSVFVYKNNSNVWEQFGQDLNGQFSNERYGDGIDLSSNGDFIAITSSKDNNLSKGIAKVYKITQNVWNQYGNTIIGERVKGDVSLSADGHTLAFATDPNINGLLGVLRVYRNISGTFWSKLGNDVKGTYPHDVLGGYDSSISISADGNIVAVGAPYVFGAVNNPSYPKYDEGYVQVWDYSKATVSTNEFVSQNFNIYPNPTSDFLIISLENNLILEQATIYNNLGQVVKTATESVIDVSHLAKGLYFVEVTTNQGKATKKVVVK